jgi:hypothetical protein
MMDDLVSWKQAIESVKSAVDPGRSIFGLFKDAKSVVGESERRAIETSLQHAQEALDQADRQIKIAEAQAAKALGYKICQCTIPPQIMLSIGYHERGEERFECPRCKKKEPSDAYFQRMRSFHRPQDGGS